MKALAVTLAVIVGALVGFYGGFHTGKGATTTAAATAAVTNVTTGPAVTAAAPAAGGATGAGRGTGGGGNGNGGFGRGTVGTVIATTSTGFTIRNAATGADTKVVFDPALEVRKTITGQASDIQNGVTVAVAGPAGTDGTVTATAVTITPATQAGG